MPNSTSASKRMRQGVKRRLRNRVTKKVIKTLSKRTFASLESKDLDKAAADLRLASAKIDKRECAGFCIQTPPLAARASLPGLQRRGGQGPTSLMPV